jgi:hypothetical protein
VPGFGREALYAVQVARALSPWWELDILCPMIGRQGHVAEFHGSRLLRVPLDADGAHAAGGFARAVRRQLADGVYDAVHVRTPLEGSVALGMHGEHGFTLVYDPAPPTGLTRILDGLAQGGATHRLLAGERELIERCDLLVVHGEHARRKALGFRAADRPVVNVSHGVDTEVFGRQRLAPSAPGIVLSLDRAVGSLGLPGVEQRGVDEPWGSEYFRPENERDLALCINAACLCVTAGPSGDDRWFESMPFGVLEAACCARPVLAPRTGAVVEVLGEGCDGFVHDPGDDADRSRAALALLQGGSELDERLERLGERVRVLYPAGAMRSRLVEAYVQLLRPSSDFPALPQGPTGP